MKNLKRVQIIVRDDSHTEQHPDQRIIFDVYRSIKRAVEFFREFGINMKQESLYHLWRNDLTPESVSFGINPEYHEKLMRLCPANKKISLNDALDQDSAHFAIQPLLD